MLIVLVASIPLFNDFLIRGHDIYFHLMRIEGLAEGLRSGQFPVKIQPAWYGGFGYAVSVFYGDLFLYPAAVLRLLGCSLQNAYKSYLFLNNVVTVLIAGYSFSGIFKNRYIGALGSAIYSLSVYRLVNLYTRGALGEYTGMMFLPLIVYACVLLLDREKKKECLQKGAVLLGISMACIVQSHILTAELVCIMLAATAVLCIRRICKKEVLLSGLRAVALALILSLWFLVPFMDYMVSGRYKISSGASDGQLIQRLGIFLSQVWPLFDNAVGESLDCAAGPQGDFAQGVGLGIFLAIPAFCIVTALQYRKKRGVREWRIALITVILGVMAIAFSTVYFPWDALCRRISIIQYVIGKIQFPWRFTAVAVVCLVTVWCTVIHWTDQSYGKRISVLIASAVLILTGLSAGHYEGDLLERAQKIQVRQQQDMDSYVASGEEYLPVGTDMESLCMEMLYADEAVEVTAFERDGITLRFHCKNASDGRKRLELPLVYYPGYQADATDQDAAGHKVRLESGENNVVCLFIDGNTDADICVSFVEPWYWRVAELISLMGFGMLIVAGVRKPSR